MHITFVDWFNYLTIESFAHVLANTNFIGCLFLSLSLFVCLYLLVWRIQFIALAAVHNAASLY